MQVETPRVGTDAGQEPKQNHQHGDVLQSSSKALFYAVDNHSRRKTQFRAHLGLQTHLIHNNCGRGLFDSCTHGGGSNEVAERCRYVREVCTLVEVFSLKLFFSLPSVSPVSVLLAFCSAHTVAETFVQIVVVRCHHLIVIVSLLCRELVHCCNATDREKIRNLQIRQ